MTTTAGERVCSTCERVRRPLRRGLCGACYERRRMRAIAYGRWEPDLVDAQPVRDHVAALIAAGMSVRGIAIAAGVDRKVLHRLLHGRPGRGTPPSRSMTPAHANAFLAVEPPTVLAEIAPGGQVVPALGTRRRLQALIAAGWPQAVLAARLGMDPSNFPRLLRCATVTAARHRAVAQLFTELQLQPGPSDRVRRTATRRGWPLPLEWDEDALDDPDAAPQRSRHTRDSTLAERREQVAELTAAVVPDQLIADRLRISTRQVLRIRRQADRG